MKIAITGHRPHKLGNDYQLVSDLIMDIKQIIQTQIDTYMPDTLITGMALGIDTLFAMIAIENGIPFIAAVPFKGQESMWPQTSRKAYLNLINQAKEIVVVSEGNFTVHKMQLRNQWMVDNCDILLAVWDGSSGGTANCVKYAIAQGKQIVHINPKTLKAEII